MLAAQVNARKHENLRMILGIEWNGGLARGFFGGLWSRLQPLAVVSGVAGPNIPPLPLRAGGSCGSPLPHVRIAGRMDARRVAIVSGAYVGRLCMMRGSIVAAVVM